MNGQPHAAGSEPGRRRRLGVLLTCCLSLFIVGLDITIVNVALPTIARRAGRRRHRAAVDGRAPTRVVMASLLMFSGSMADRLGRRRTFVTGLIVFSSASALCSLAPTVEAARSRSGSSRRSAARCSTRWPCRSSPTPSPTRANALRRSASGARCSASRMALGPIVGGTLVSSVGWRAIFLINVPIGLAAIALTLRLVPESKAPDARVASTPSDSSSSPSCWPRSPTASSRRRGTGGRSRIVAAFAAPALALVALLRLRAAPRRAAHRPAVLPLDPLRVVDRRRRWPRSPRSAASCSSTRSTSRTSAACRRCEAGLTTLPMALMTVLISPLSGRMVGRRGPRLPLVIAGVAFDVACAMLDRARRRDAASPG